MADEVRMNLRFKDEEIARKFTNIAKARNISVNQLACDVLEKYAKVGDKYLIDALPIITKSLTEEILMKLVEEQNEALKDYYITMIKLKQITETLSTFLLPEYQDVSYDNMKSDELLRLLNAMEK